MDGAIHRREVLLILAECRQIVSKIGRLAVGKAVITTGGICRKHVMRTVGPVYRGGGQGRPRRSRAVIGKSIRLADAQGLTSLSFPAISTGAFGYPASEAAPVALSSAIDALRSVNSVKLSLCSFRLGRSQ